MINQDRCHHRETKPTFDISKTVLLSLHCAICEMQLFCNNCKYGQFDGHRNTYYCIKREESQFGSYVCIDWKFHKSFK